VSLRRKREARQKWSPKGGWLASFNQEEAVPVFPEDKKKNGGERKKEKSRHIKKKNKQLGNKKIKRNVAMLSIPLLDR